MPVGRTDGRLLLICPFAGRTHLVVREALCVGTDPPARHAREWFCLIIGNLFAPVSSGPAGLPNVEVLTDQHLGPSPNLLRQSVPINVAVSEGGGAERTA